MGPNSKDAVVATLGHLIDELLQQRITLQRIESKVEARADSAADDIKQVGKRVLDVERAYVNLRNRVDGLPPTPAE